MFLRNVLIFTLVIYCASCLPSSNNTSIRRSRRIHIPALGLGPTCNGCPEHFCDDDPAIIHGYCCGCARFYDSLPVTCSSRLNCPLNGHSLCEDYEYMMYCCCGK